MIAKTVEALLVRGAPGVGKSSAVKRLRRRIQDGALIEVDQLRGMIAGVRWVDAAQHAVALEHALLLLESFLAKGFRPVIVVDTFSRGKLTAFTARLRCSYRVASLWAEPEELARRIAHRPKGQFKDLAASSALNEEVRRNRYPHEELVDTTELSPEGVCDALERSLRGSMETAG